MKTVFVSVILLFASLGARAEDHQPLKIDFNMMIEDATREGQQIHEHITRQIQNIDGDQADPQPQLVKSETSTINDTN